MAARHVLALGCLLATFILATPATGHAAVSGGDAAAIRSVMQQQEADWNRGDVDAFMHGYRDSPDTTFVGSTVRKGYRTILADYRRHYTGKAQMGRLTFSGLDVRLLPGADGRVRYAVVTGRFHLDRTRHGAVAQDDGVFSLLWEKTAAGWKIIVDHTS